MNKDELREQRRLLQQQLGLVNRRTERAALLLSRKRAAKPLPAGIETFAEHKKNEANKEISKSTGELTHPISAPCPVPLGGRIEKIRQRALIHRVDLTERRRDRKVIVPSPGKAGAYRKQTVETTMFPTRYSRGELPCAIEHRVSGATRLLLSQNHRVTYGHVRRKRVVVGLPAPQPRLRALFTHLFRRSAMHRGPVQVHGSPSALYAQRKRACFFGTGASPAPRGHRGPMSCWRRRVATPSASCHAFRA